MTTSWPKKLFLYSSPLTRPVVRLLARPGRVAMVMVVRDEADILPHSIEFHLRHGIEHFVVMDNGSVDGTRDLLRDFERSLGGNFLVLDDPRDSHEQAERVTRMVHLAKQRFTPRWIFPSDADEFWYPVSGRYDTEFDGRANILNCVWHNFLPRPDVPWQTFTDIGEMPGYRADTSKALCLARGLRGLYLGNHEARAIPQVAARSENIRLYHYPIRTYAQFERKVVQGHRAADKSSASKSASWHWRDYYRVWEQGRLPDLFASLAIYNRIGTDDTMAKWFGTQAGAGARAAS